MADSFEALVSLPKFSIHSSPPFDSVHPEHFLGLAQLPAASPRPADHHMAPPQVSRNCPSRPSVHPTVAGNAAAPAMPPWTPPPCSYLASSGRHSSAPSVSPRPPCLTDRKYTHLGAGKLIVGRNASELKS
ncbi:hypothetical protein PVAP13_1KG065700 [Panicum virgatum]|uniref:Uncharacterized protein n=1 Tax=Panicum virgatum TaxID=38727 RepID=A0A8T0XAV8_PANVG|nr:hypothetical protein PVAP13_1KG065700 [Panicum virgatum]